MLRPELACGKHHVAVRTCVTRYNSREAELRSLRMEVDRLSGAVSSAEDDARRAADALRARLVAKQAELDETQAHLEATQVQRLHPVYALDVNTSACLPSTYTSGVEKQPQAAGCFAALVAWFSSSQGHTSSA